MLRWFRDWWIGLIRIRALRDRIYMLEESQQNLRNELDRAFTTLGEEFSDDPVNDDLELVIRRVLMARNEERAKVERLRTLIRERVRYTVANEILKTAEMVEVKR